MLALYLLYSGTETSSKQCSWNLSDILRWKSALLPLIKNLSDAKPNIFSLPTKNSLSFKFIAQTAIYIFKVIFCVSQHWVQSFLHLDIVFWRYKWMCIKYFHVYVFPQLCFSYQARFSSTNCRRKNQRIVWKTFPYEIKDCLIQKLYKTVAIYRISKLN